VRCLFGFGIQRECKIGYIFDSNSASCVPGDQENCLAD
jgi:hypothetical protein